ncbi:hypothetical protein WMY93_034038 [Mugilogobius chulae]|uniref:PDZ domain-containing protein n=1 Tax=Mugilogobius chulae TaxID=88201 RepID=A0AAW0MH36_9GOBI
MFVILKLDLRCLFSKSSMRSERDLFSTCKCLIVASALVRLVSRRGLTIVSEVVVELEIELTLEKTKGEILGVVIVESGWGSILPTVILANMMNGGPAARSGKLKIGDQIMSINNTSLVGLPLATWLEEQVQVKMNIVSCPPVTTVLIKRPDLKYQLGFSVQNGIICSLMRGGIAERGGVRVGHRIIEINGQSVVATAHEKIVQALSNSVGEIHMKTMPAAMFRLLTGQETPMYI